MIQPAFGFGEGSQVLARISQQQDPHHALGILGGKVANDAGDDVGFVLAVRTIDRNQPSLRAKIVLDKIPGRKFGSRNFASGGKHFDDLVGIDQPALAHADDFLIVLARAV